jgi:hypothetical protein
VVPPSGSPTAVSYLDDTGGAEPGGATLHHRLTHSPTRGQDEHRLHKKARHDTLSIQSSTRDLSGPCEKKASSDTVTAPLGDLDVTPYSRGSSSSTSLPLTRLRPGLDLNKPEVLLLVSGRLPLSTTVSSDGFNKDGEGINKRDILDNKKDHSNNDGRDNKYLDSAPSSLKKSRTGYTLNESKALNKHGLPLVTHGSDTVGETSSLHDSLERSIRKDSDMKDLARVRPASRLDRLRATHPPSESRASERERSRSGDR